jgi:hypothetical protein
VQFIAKFKKNQSVRDWFYFLLSVLNRFWKF